MTLFTLFPSVFFFQFTFTLKMIIVIAREYFTKIKYTAIFAVNILLIHYFVYEGLTRKNIAFGMFNLKRIIDNHVSIRA